MLFCSGYTYLWPFCITFNTRYIVSENHFKMNRFLRAQKRLQQLFLQFVASYVKYDENSPAKKTVSGSFT